MISPNVYTIPPEHAFADALAQWVLREYGSDPLTLTRLRILLPTRRACRSLSEAFLRASGYKPLLLPRLQPIGDVEEDEWLLTGSESLARRLASIPPAVSSVKYRLMLTHLVSRADPAASIDQSARLAGELVSFMDEVEREEVSFSNLKNLVPDELSAHWQKTVEFLKILSEHWPGWLEQEGVVTPMQRRIRLLQALAQEWQETPPSYPVIAAGSTGSIPAVARLLKVIAHLPEGKVILPGVDMQAPDEVWQALSETHPQFGLKQVLEAIGCARADINVLEDGPTSLTARAHLLNRMFDPAFGTLENTKESLAGLSTVTCENAQSEAEAIALKLRACLEQEGKTAALVTRNRGLARRVALIMRRYGIDIDDSAGIPLALTPPAVFLRLLNDVASSRASAEKLLALLKHPFAAGGMEPAAFRDLARELEVSALRGIQPGQGIEALLEHPALSAAVRAMLERVAECCREFSALINWASAPIAELVTAHMAAAEALASGAEDGRARLWRGEDGERLSNFLAELKQSADVMGEIHPVSYTGLFEALLEGQVVRPRYGRHPRVHILSPQEARLQHFDTVILGDMNEGSWPLDVGDDPWMSRPMRASFGLSAHERQVGQSAHDFVTLACAKECVITRAGKVAGVPTIPSRWLLRLTTWLSTASLEGALEDRAWHAWAQRLHMPEAVASIDPPSPKPPLSVRPKRLSVTEIEKLLRDPYAIYARRVLRLKALDPLGQLPGGREFGSLLHKALEEVAKENPPLEAMLGKILGHARTLCEAYKDYPAIAAFWWPRIENVAHWLVEEESRRRAAGLQSVWAEIDGRLRVGETELVGRIDRLEMDARGHASIVDYKTGELPKKEDRERGLSPQLALCALLVENGDVAALNGGRPTVANLEYWKLGGGREPGVIAAEAYTDELRKETLDGLGRVLNAFLKESTPYLACPSLADRPKYNDYEHLERLGEWAFV